MQKEKTGSYLSLESLVPSQPSIPIKNQLLCYLDRSGPFCIDGFDKVNHSVTREALFVPFWSHGCTLVLHCWAFSVGELEPCLEVSLSQRQVWSPCGLDCPVTGAPHPLCGLCHQKPYNGIHGEVPLLPSPLWAEWWPCAFLALLTLPTESHAGNNWMQKEVFRF